MATRQERFKLLYKLFEEDTTRARNRERINHYIELLKDFKRKELEDRYEWAKNLDEIETFGTRSWNSEPSTKEIREREIKVKNQLDRILFEFHLDRNEALGIKKEGMPTANNPMGSSPVINVYSNLSQSQGQNQSTSVNVNVEINMLVKELNEELDKKKPDKAVVKSKMERLLSIANIASPYAEPNLKTHQ